MALFDLILVKRAIGDIGKEVKRLRAERDQAMRQREDLQSLPLAKADFQALLEAWVDRQGAGFAERLQTGTAFYLRNPMSSLPDDSKAPTHPMRVLTACKNPEDMATVGGLEINLFALLGPSIKQGLRAIVEGMNFVNAGPPRDERIVTIAALDKRIIEIDAQEKELLEAAEAAGVKLQ